MRGLLAPSRPSILRIYLSKIWRQCLTQGFTTVCAICASIYILKVGRNGGDDRWRNTCAAMAGTFMNPKVRRIVRSVETTILFRRTMQATARRLPRQIYTDRRRTNDAK